jgi:hypothetical protein
LPELAGKITGNATVNKEMYVDILRRLRDAVRRERPPKKENQQLISPSRQCRTKPAAFVQEFHSKEKCDNT